MGAKNETLNSGKNMKYTVVDGFTITGCPFRPDRHVGGFACAMCEHWTDPGIHVSGARAGDPGTSVWEVGCDLEDADKVDRGVLVKRRSIRKMMEYRFGPDWKKP